MNNTSENKIIGFIESVIKNIFGFIVFLAVGLIIFSILFAPIYGVYYSGKMAERYGINSAEYKQHMLSIWVVTWGISITAWICVFVYGYLPYTHNACMP